MSVDRTLVISSYKLRNLRREGEVMGDFLLWGAINGWKSWDVLGLDLYYYFNY